MNKKECDRLINIYLYISGHHQIINIFIKPRQLLVIKVIVFDRRFKWQGYNCRKTQQHVTE